MRSISVQDTVLLTGARSVPGVCNAYLPEDTTLERFLWVVNYFAEQGFYIILDNQFNLDQTATQDTQLWLSRVGAFIYCLLHERSHRTINPWLQRAYMGIITRPRHARFLCSCRWGCMMWTCAADIVWRHARRGRRSR